MKSMWASVWNGFEIDSKRSLQEIKHPNAFDCDGIEFSYLGLL